MKQFHALTTAARRRLADWLARLATAVDPDWYPRARRVTWSVPDAARRVRDAGQVRDG